LVCLLCLWVFTLSWQRRCEVHYDLRTLERPLPVTRIIKLQPEEKFLHREYGQTNCHEMDHTSVAGMPSSAQISPYRFDS